MYVRTSCWFVYIYISIQPNVLFFSCDVLHLLGGNLYTSCWPQTATPLCPTSWYGSQQRAAYCLYVRWSWSVWVRVRTLRSSAFSYPFFLFRHAASLEWRKSEGEPSSWVFLSGTVLLLLLLSRWRSSVQQLQLSVVAECPMGRGMIRYNNWDMKAIRWVRLQPAELRSLLCRRLPFVPSSPPTVNWLPEPPIVFVCGRGVYRYKSSLHLGRHACAVVSRP